MTRTSKRKEAGVEAEGGKKAKNDREPVEVAAAAAVAAVEELSAKSSPKKRSAQAKANTHFTPQDFVSGFDRLFIEMIAYHADTGNYNVNRDDHPELFGWLQFVKKEFKAYIQDPNTSSLSETQVKVMEHLHFPVTSRGDDHWNRFYELLKKYGERHGHVLVPRLCEVPGLGDWVTDQRRQYKAWRQGQTSQLTAERREKLEALGFQWTVRSRPEWELRYQQLLEYKQKYGDCKVPQHYKENKALGKWVAKQREQFKLMKKGHHTFLTPYRLEQLNMAGFTWQVRTSLDTDDGTETGEADGEGEAKVATGVSEDV